MKKSLVCAGAVAALALLSDAQGKDNSDDSLTWLGITLYGTIDVGYTYQNRGAPLNDYFPAGLQQLIQPSNNRSISSVSENNLSQSKLGIQGTHEFVPGWSGLFKLETGFNPLSGNISDAVKAVTQDNGVPLTNRTAAADGSRAGQPFQGAAYGGFSSPKYGTLTFGRQNGLLADNVLKYDPLSGSYAFSVIGWSGAAGGSGDTQDLRLDSSIKYVNQIDMFRVGAQFQGGAGTASGGNAREADLGADLLHSLSVDATYANKKGAILASPLGVAVPKCPTTPAFGGASSAVDCLPAGISPANAVAATVSDNSTWSLDASYVYQRAKVSTGYENIHFHNPQTPLAAGSPDIGGYTLGFVNNDAYGHGAKMLQIMWLGTTYSFSEHLDLTGAWYHYNQNNYNPTVKCSGGTKDSSGCSGRLDAYSLVADYKFDRHFDVYSGFMWSHVADGLAAGYLSSWTIDPTIGGRFSF